MKKRIALIESGFMGSYINEFMQLCTKHNIKVDTYKQGEDFLTKYKPKNFFNIFKLDKEVKQLLKNKQYDFIISDGMPLSFTCNVFHNVSLIKRIRLAPFFLYKLIFSLGHLHKIIHVKHFYKNCPKTIVVSNVLKQDYSKNCNIPENTIIVAHPGINVNETNKFSTLKTREINKPFVIGMNANGFVTKGGYVLLRALRILKKKHPDLNIKAKIIFPKYDKNIPVKLYVRLFGLSGSVEFLPYQNDIKSFYQSLDCFICPSLLEAFARVVTEAMSCKTPVIVSSDVGASDIINDGENGFVYKKDQNYTENLAEKIKYVYDNYDKMSRIAENGYNTASELTWENFARSLFSGLYPKTEFND